MATDVRVVTRSPPGVFGTAPRFRALERPDLTISHVEIETGPASIECEYDEALAVPGTIAKIIEAERDGCDAVVIDCMGDPGMLPGRECVSIPVIGPCEAAMHVASMLGTPSAWSPCSSGCARSSSIRHRSTACARSSLRSVPSRSRCWSWSRTSTVPRRRLRRRRCWRSRRTAPMRSASAAPVCWAAPRPCAEACSPGATDVPVVDPVPWAVKLAASLVDAGLSHSKITYERPPSKARGRLRDSAADEPHPRRRRVGVAPSRMD